MNAGEGPVKLCEQGIEGKCKHIPTGEDHIVETGACRKGRGFADTFPEPASHPIPLCRGAGLFRDRKPKAGLIAVAALNRLQRKSPKRRAPPRAGGEEIGAFQQVAQERRTPVPV